MLTRSFVTLVALSFVAGCAMEATEEPAFDESETIGVQQEALTANCAGSIVRRKLNGKISTSSTAELVDQEGGVNTDTNYKKRCTTSFTMAVGDRHYARIIGANSSGGANPASLWVERLLSDGWTKVKTKSTVGTSTEKVDWSVDVAGTYRVCAVADDTTESGSDYIRLTSDRSNPAYCGAPGSAIDYCFGASSADCDQCSTNSDGKQDCPVSVGSAMHDTCCAHNPLGDNCNGSACNPGSSGTNCGWISNCSKEDDHAWNDGYASRRWNKTYDPTVPYYRPLSPSDRSGDYADFYSTDYNKSKPTALSAKAPSGQGIWDVDAENGWCASGSYGSRLWSVQGYYRICN